MYLVYAEKIIGLAVVLSALTVGFITLHHDIPLGLLFLLGQVQAVISHHGHNGPNHDAVHAAMHKINH